MFFIFCKDLPVKGNHLYRTKWTGAGLQASTPTLRTIVSKRSRWLADETMKNDVNILIAHDFSDCSTQALNYGIEFALENQATLHILYVDVPFEAPDTPNASSRPNAVELEQKLIASINKSVALLGCTVEDIPGLQFTVSRDVGAAQAIITYGNEHNIDLVVLGTHGRKGLRRKIMGSVAEAVVRRAPCTVFTVREELPFRPLVSRLRAIAVPFDFSDHALKALLFAKEMAATFGATLDIIHVIEKHLHPSFYQSGIASVYKEGTQLENKVLKALRQIVAELPGEPVPVAFTVLGGHPVKQTIEWIEKQTHNLIVVSTHGHTGIDRALVGSVAERIVRLAPCPVFTVKPPRIAPKSSDLKQAITCL